MENLFRAYKEARRSKRRIRKYPELAKFEKDLNLSLCKLQLELINGTWKPSGKYRRFVTWDTGKERIVDWNPSFVDNVVQHAIQQTAGQVLLRAGIRDTYSGIPGRGVHDGVKRIARFLKEYRMDLMPCYVMKLDVRKFYASIDLDRLKEKIRRRIKDQRMLHVIDQVIDSHPNGLPIGNYLSQHLANFFLADFDQAVKAQSVKHYGRYCDDIVAISSEKEKLKELMKFSIGYNGGNALQIKSNAQVFPIERNGIDFLGYVFHRHSIRLRKRNERNFRKAGREFLENPCEETLHPLASYNGELKWTSHGEKLWRKVVKKPLKQLQQEVRNAEKHSRKHEDRFPGRNAVRRASHAPA